MEVFLDHDGEVFDGGSALLIRVCNKVTGNGEANARFGPFIIFAYLAVSSFLGLFL